jgi:hypothetical protein
MFDEDAPPAVFGERKFNYLLYAFTVLIISQINFNA